MSGSRFARQTVRLAIDCVTGELTPAESLLALSEAEFTALRRETMKARMRRRRAPADGDATDSLRRRFVCVCCERPLYLSRHVRGEGNRWFVHDGPSSGCPWYEGTRLTPDQVKALIYRGQQEGQAHRDLKLFLATWLERDALVSEVSLEKTTFSEVVKGQWRRPDVQCNYAGKQVVFEIQLSYTFLSDVIARDDFYRREGVYIIWVFAKFELRRAAVTDEAFFNRRNVFVLDSVAKANTVARRSLTFECYRQVPEWTHEGERNDWSAVPVEMADVLFPEDRLRPYFFDYDGYRSQMLDAYGKSWRGCIDAYRQAALAYFDGAYAPELRKGLLEVVEAMAAHPYWSREFDALRDAAFMGYQGFFAVMLSIELHRPVGHARCGTVFAVLSHALSEGTHGPDRHGLAILYLWAYKTYKPAVSDLDRQWIHDYAHGVKRSIEAGEGRYLRMDMYDEIVACLFPDMEMLLRWEDFGRDRH